MPSVLISMAPTVLQPRYSEEKRKFFDFAVCGSEISAVKLHFDGRRLLFEKFGLPLRMGTRTQSQGTENSNVVKEKEKQNLIILCPICSWGLARLARFCRFSISSATQCPFLGAKSQGKIS